MDQALNFWTMVQLFWGILNLILILSFFYLFIGLVVKGRNFLKPYPKVYTIPILFLGVMGFLKNTTGKAKEIPVYKGFASMDEIELSENLTNKIHFVLVRDRDTREIFYEGSFSRISGFVLGLEWKHLGIVEYENKIEVMGCYSFKLLGNEVFSPFESFLIEKDQLDTP